MPIDRLPCILGIAGPIAAGKTTITRILATELGFSTLSFGDLVMRHLSEKQALAGGPKVLRAESQHLIAELGYEGLTRELVQSMDGNPLQAIEGIRHPDVAQCLKEIFSDSFHLLYVDAPKVLRAARFVARRRFDGDTEPAAFSEQEAASIEADTPLLKPLAERVLSNAGERAQLRRDVAQYVASCQSGTL